jgi:hypothetical protein
MKKILRGVCMIAVVALAFTSCKKNNQTEGIRFSGTTEAFAGGTVDEDRAYIGTNSTNTFFEVNDQIMVYNLDSEDATQTNYGIYWTDKAGHKVDWYYSSGTVINHKDASTTTLFAFYPAEIVNNARLWEGDNEAMFEITDHQTYRKIGSQVVLPKGTLAMASKDEIATNVDEKDFQFRNIMGFLWLKLTDSQNRKITSIVYEDNVLNVTGRVHLKIDEVDPDYLRDYLLKEYDPNNTTYMANLNDYISRSGYYVDDANVALKGKTITLDCGEGVQLNPSSVQHFMITLRPLAAYYGFKLTFNFADGDPLVYDYNGLTPKQRMIQPNKWLALTRNLANL